MSFKSLLFCPDEKTARVVTQVLSELDFTVETEAESFASVKRLTEEHFDALVVDCQNEQDASLLFKAARNSTQNSSSLSVAVVEGQAGVAKAFRIGANLVLTKPINVEQSKSTLRVARGLLKKVQPKPGAPASSASAGQSAIPKKQAEEFSPTSGALSKPTFNTVPPSTFASSQSTISPAGSIPVSATTRPSAPASSVPFSGLVLENEPEPTPQAEDLALLESLPQISGKRPAETQAPSMLGQAGPIAASTSGQAAATALAPDPKVLEFRTAGAAPMVTNEAIVSGIEPAAAFEPELFAAPTFSSLESASGHSTGGGRFLKIAVLLALVAVGGYFAWQQPQLQPYLQKLLHRGSSAQVNPASTEASEPSSTSQPVTFQPPIEATPGDTQDVQEASGHPSVSTPTMTAAPHAASQKNSATESVEVQELPIARDSAKLPVMPKPQPIVVKNEAATEKPTQPAPPPVDVISEANRGKLPDLVPVNVQLPKPSPGTVRISQGVSQGLLLKKVQPVYPPIAQQLHKEGIVQLLTTITKYGNVSKVQVLGGDPLLAKAAVDAVKQWEYRPYLLNGLPVEIETQITIVFKSRL